MQYRLTKICLVTLACCLGCNSLLLAQSFFSIDVDSLTRRYNIVKKPGGGEPNQPLVIILHANQTPALEVNTLSEKMIAVNKNIVFAIPLGINARWGCAREENDINIKQNDIALIKKIIADAHEYYTIDRNRVYIISDTTSSCLGNFLMNEPEDIVAKHLIAPDMQTDSLISYLQTVQFSNEWITSKKYELYIDESQIKEANRAAMLSNFKKRWALSLGIGPFMLFNSAVAPEKNSTVNIQDYKTMLDIKAGYFFTQSLSLNASIRWLIIKKYQNINHVSIGSDGLNVDASGSGGALIPTTLNVQYHLLTNNKRPYLSLGGGYIVGGIKSGGINVQSGTLDKKIETTKFSTPLFTAAAGFEWRLTPGFGLNVETSYLHSLRYSEEVGNTVLLRGMQVAISTSFYFGSH